jgi:hypothetical protein
MIDAQLVGDLLRLVGTGTMDVRQRDDHTLVGGDVYPGNTSHLVLHAPQGLEPKQRPYLIAFVREDGKKPGWRARGRRLPDLSRFLECGALSGIRKARQQPKWRKGNSLALPATIAIPAIRSYL